MKQEEAGLKKIVKRVRRTLERARTKAERNKWGKQVANPEAKPRTYPTVDGILEGFVPKTVTALRTLRTEATMPPTFIIEFRVRGVDHKVTSPQEPNGDIPIRELLTKIRLIAD